jgi:hypothetical protein
MADGCYHYTGEGQHGDQEIKSGNAAILRHKREGRALRLFKGVRGEVEYLGEFETDEELPFYNTDAPEADDGPVRSVIVFRLRPLMQKTIQANVGEVVAGRNKVDLVAVETLPNANNKRPYGTSKPHNWNPLRLWRGGNLHRHRTETSF